PTLSEIPEIEVLVTEDAPSPLNPLGVKGAGEGGTAAAAAAIASAIDDALQRPGAVTSVPVLPSHLRKVLHDAHVARVDPRTLADSRRNLQNATRERVRGRH